MIQHNNATRFQVSKAQQQIKTGQNTGQILDVLQEESY